MTDSHNQTLSPTALLVVRSIDCDGGLYKLLKQSFKSPVGLHLLIGLTVLESASDQLSQSRVVVLHSPMPY